MQTRIFHLQNLTALHVGTGQGVGVVDLPIARSKATNLPIVPGSAIKGVLRDELKDTHKLETTDINTLFGKDKDADHAGAIAFGDAQILLLPIRSFAGTVAYATCPYILRQYQRDVGVTLNIPTISDNTAYVVDNSALIISNNMVALEDLDIKATVSKDAQAIIHQITTLLYPAGSLNAEEWQTEIAKRFIILPDNIFSFLADTATEIRTRIRINRETRIVQQGALWTEENLPADSVLWGVIGVSDSRSGDKKSAVELAKLLPQETSIQIGGKHTVGRGFCRLLIAE